MGAAPRPGSEQSKSPTALSYETDGLVGTWAKGLNKEFTAQETPVAREPVRGKKRYATSLVVGEVQTEMTRWARMKTSAPFRDREAGGEPVGRHATAALDSFLSGYQFSECGRGPFQEPFQNVFYTTHAS